MFIKLTQRKCIIESDDADCLWHGKKNKYNLSFIVNNEYGTAGWLWERVQHVRRFMQNIFFLNKLRVLYQIQLCIEIL